MSNLLQIKKQTQYDKSVKDTASNENSKKEAKRRRKVNFRITESECSFPNLQVNNISRVSKRIGRNAVQFVSRQIAEKKEQSYKREIHFKSRSSKKKVLDKGTYSSFKDFEDNIGQVLKLFSFRDLKENKSNNCMSPPSRNTLTILFTPASLQTCLFKHLRPAAVIVTCDQAFFIYLSNSFTQFFWRREHKKNFLRNSHLRQNKI